jgi:2-polyprenyl-3-methyl-5-hydroxy-6-metoxy-1,4-benzoquinol methylase
MSLAQLGAHVTAVDFSEEAIKKAKEFNDELGLNVDFICANIYELPSVLDKNTITFLQVMGL